MVIDLFFSRHLREDFPKIKKGLLEILDGEQATIVIEGNQISVPDSVLLNNNIPAFYSLYKQDLSGKEMIEKNSAFLDFIFKKMESTPYLKSSDSIDYELYKLAIEKKFEIKHEITSPDVLFTLQKNYLLWSLLPSNFEEGRIDEYIATMRQVLEEHKENTYKRDGIFFRQLKSLEAEDEEKRVISTRGLVHSYMAMMLEDKGINFHGNLNPVFDDIMTTLAYKNLMLLDISDDELVGLYHEVKSYNTT